MLPGSKSISNRTLLLAALASGTTRLFGLLDADDTAHMLDALRTLGVLVERTPDAATVLGTGGPVSGSRRVAVPRQCGNGRASAHRGAGRAGR